MIGTSNEPSRFLEESRVTETEKIMRPLQWLAAGDQRAREVLIRALQNGGVTPNLMQNLINGYLSDIGEDELVNQMMSSTHAGEPVDVLKEVMNL